MRSAKQVPPTVKLAAISCEELFGFRLIVLDYRQFIIIIGDNIFLSGVFEDKLFIGCDIRKEFFNRFIGIRQGLLRACL